MSRIDLCGTLDSIGFECEKIKKAEVGRLRIGLLCDFRKVVRKTQPPISPKLLVRDLEQPIRGDLRMKV